MLKLCRYTIKFLDSLLLLGIILFIYTWKIEPRWVKFEYVDMPVHYLPDSLNNTILVQISDIHIGETVDDAYIIRTFQKINKLKPDFVVYTGDFISPIDTNKASYEQLNKVLTHKAKGRLGTIAILGNHDYGILARNAKTADSLAIILKKNNIELLRNNITNKSGLNFIGIDDYWGTNFKPNNAMKLYQPDSATIVLCHNPDVLDLDNIWDNYKGWILSGHTHGGQVKIPFGKAIKIPVDNKNYEQGLIEIDKSKKLYINRGLGHSIPIRFNVRPEITVFQLKKAIAKS